MCLCHNSQWEMIINLLPCSWGELSRQTVITIVINTLLAWSRKIVVGTCLWKGQDLCTQKHAPGSLESLALLAISFPLHWNLFISEQKEVNLKRWKICSTLKNWQHIGMLYHQDNLMDRIKQRALFIWMCCFLFICLLRQTWKETLTSASVCTQRSLRHASRCCKINRVSYWLLQVVTQLSGLTFSRCCHSS